MGVVSRLPRRRKRGRASRHASCGRQFRQKYGDVMSARSPQRPDPTAPLTEASSRLRAPALHDEGAPSEGHVPHVHGGLGLFRLVTTVITLIIGGGVFTLAGEPGGSMVPAVRPSSRPGASPVWECFAWS